MNHVQHLPGPISPPFADAQHQQQMGPAGAEGGVAYYNNNKTPITADQGFTTPQQHHQQPQQHYSQHQQHHPQRSYDGLDGAGGQAGHPMHMQFAAAPLGQPQYPYTNAPTPAAQQQPAPLPATAAANAVRHSASPSNQHFQSPYAAGRQQPSQHEQPSPQLYHQQQQQTFSQPHHPMAAPPFPPPGGNPQQQGQSRSGSNSAASPNTPQSPGHQSLEQKRVALILEINLELLQEVNSLQAQGKGGAMNVLQQQQLKAQGQNLDLATAEYIDCLQRISANLTYLTPLHTGTKNPKQLPGPSLMTPPPHMPQLQPMYDRLKEAFPGWPGRDAQYAQQRAAGAASPSTNTNTPPTNAGMNAGVGSNTATPV